MSSSVGSSSSSSSQPPPPWNSNVVHNNNNNNSSSSSSSPRTLHVVSIKALRSSAKQEDFGEKKLLSGDIVQQLVCSDGLHLTAPFAGGKSGLQKELRRLYSAGQTELTVKVSRNGGRIAAIQTCIAPDDSAVLKKLYVLKAPHDPSHVVAFTDSTHAECLQLQDLRCQRMVSHLSKAQLTDISVPYTWEEKMKQLQPAGPGPSTTFSLLITPLASGNNTAYYGNLEDTVTRAMTWLYASQIAGVPITFLSIQTEPLLTKVSGQHASSSTVSSSSINDLSNIVNTGIYGFEDYHGIDIGVVRSVRLWYVANCSEVPVWLKVEEDETRLGLVISRTEEGFCYISSVDPGTAADRAGMRNLLAAAHDSDKLLVISRVADEKVTPWLVSSDGSICCFDTNSISQKLSAHRHAGQPARIHLMAPMAMASGDLAMRVSCGSETSGSCSNNGATTIQTQLLQLHMDG